MNLVSIHEPWFVHNSSEMFRVLVHEMTKSGYIFDRRPQPAQFMISIVDCWILLMIHHIHIMELSRLVTWWAWLPRFFFFGLHFVRCHNGSCRSVSQAFTLQLCPSPNPLWFFRLALISRNGAWEIIQYGKWMEMRRHDRWWFLVVSKSVRIEQWTFVINHDQPVVWRCGTFESCRNHQAD